MPEIEFRLDELRDAADTLDRSSKQIYVSVAAVHKVIDRVLLQYPEELQGTPLAIYYYQQRDQMNAWSENLMTFARNLNRATDDLHRALSDDLPARANALPTPQQSRAPRSSGGRSFYLGAAAQSAATEKPDEINTPDRNYKLRDYISEANRPAFDRLDRDQLALKAQQNQLDELLSARQNTFDDIEAHRDRVLSFDPQADVENTPRIQMLRAEIAQMDQQIRAVEENIADLQIEVNDLSARLELIKPGVNADLDLIASLENSVTSDWIKDHTHGCVNHIVEKIPIPGGIPLDAHRWDESITQLQGYGITSGDTPLVGAVIQFEREHSYADDTYGHLMYIERIDANGEIWITDNTYPETPVKLSDLTDELDGPNMRYIYVPWHTRA